MERAMVASSNIISVGYDSAAEVLEIEFKDGGVYQYYNVPEVVHTQLMGAPSAGQYHHMYIKGQYNFSRV